MKSITIRFFSIYKELEGRVAITQGWGGPREARRCILESRQRYLDSKLSPEPQSEGV